MLTLVGVVLTGCVSWLSVLPGMGGAVGTTSYGLLLGGEHLPRSGGHFRSYKRLDRRYGVSALTGIIERSAAKVAETRPPAQLLVGDISGPHGGHISGHRSHRSGRDADFGFYVTDLYGNPGEGVPLPRFDRFGIGVRDGEIVRFDVPRNWMLVEAMLTDPEADVQWIFVSHGLKALLLEWALENDRDLDVIQRAAKVLHQPGDSAPHNDHYHVRVFCPADNQGDFCVDTGPVWPWQAPAPGFSQSDLAALALEGYEAAPTSRATDMAKREEMQ